MANVLVVGGAGYIGSHTCLDLSRKGFTPIVYDNLSNGHESFVQWGPFEEGDLHDGERLDAVIARYSPAAIVHFAALIEVGESVRDPIGFYQNNVSGTLSLLAAAKRGGIDRIVFSSTCATYGEPQAIPMTEAHPQAPINPYGRSKQIIEQILVDCDIHQSIRSVVLRYFNAAGADPEGRIGEWHDPESHAIPIAIDVALGRRDRFTIYGTDYDTRDGTCVRDYIHVQDLADAHSRAVKYLIDGGASTALNLGTGTGTTVRELLETIEDVAGHPVGATMGERRLGDSPMLVANNEKAWQVLGWRPSRGLNEIVASAWNWHKKLNTQCG